MIEAPSVLFNKMNIIHMTTAVSRSLNMRCIMFKIIAFFVITLFARLYARVGILEGTCMTTSPRVEVWAHKLDRHFLLK